MPIYEYRCRQCGHGFEYLVLASSPPAKCPACQGEDLTQQISLSAMSSEASRTANFNSARSKAAGDRKAKQSEEHKHLHEHFED